MFKGIIFDIDGTLTSTNQLIFDSFNHIAKKYLNKTFSDGEITAMFGPTEEVIIRLWCGDNYEAARKDYYDYYKSHHNIAKLYPGMKEILGMLKDKKILLSIFTGKGRKSSIITLEELGILNYFDMIVTGDEVTDHKPAPEGIISFLKEYNLKNDEVLMIGDSAGDVKASRDAGIKIASALWDSYAAEKVKQLGSDYYFGNVDDLRMFLIDKTWYKYFNYLFSTVYIIIWLFINTIYIYCFHLTYKSKPAHFNQNALPFYIYNKILYFKKITAPAPQKNCYRITWPKIFEVKRINEMSVKKQILFDPDFIGGVNLF